MAVGKPERRDARAGERVTARDDVRLIGVATEAMQHGRPADRIRLRQMQHAVELGVLDANPDTLCGHSGVAAAAFGGISGSANSSKTFRRSSIGVRELMSSSTFFRPFIFPTRIAPTSLSRRKKSRL